MAAGALLSSPASVRAEDASDRNVVDARLEGLATPNARGYEDLTKNFGSGYSLSWILFIVLGVLASGVLFKNARRSHLD